MRRSFDAVGDGPIVINNCPMNPHKPQWAMLSVSSRQKMPTISCRRVCALQFSDMNFSFQSIVVGLIFSAIGFVYFSYGKKMAQPAFALGGLTLMIYPYFIDSIPITIGVGIALAFAPFLARRAGW
jgi:hypothetical protein